MITRTTFDQKSTYLCTIFAVSDIFRYCIKKFLLSRRLFYDKKDVLGDSLLTQKNILLTIIFNLVPRTAEGLDLQQHEPEIDTSTQDLQKTELIRVLNRLTKKSYLEDEGWKIILHMTKMQEKYPEYFSRTSFSPRKMIQKEIFLSYDLQACEPMIGTICYLSQGEVGFHSVVIDKIVKNDRNEDEFVIKGMCLLFFSLILRLLAM